MARRRLLDRWLSSIIAVVGTVAVVLAFLAVFGQEPVGGGADDTDTVAAPSSSATRSPSRTASRSPSPTEDETPTPTPSKSEAAATAPVVVLNQVGKAGLAGRTADRLEDGGWEVVGTGDFNGTVPANTVYYPAGLEDAATALTEQFPDITSRSRESFSGLRDDALTLIIATDYED